MALELPGPGHRDQERMRRGCKSASGGGGERVALVDELRRL
jgi:hypothetical protein